MIDFVIVLDIQQMIHPWIIIIQWERFWNYLEKIIVKIEQKYYL